MESSSNNKGIRYYLNNNVWLLYLILALVSFAVYFHTLNYGYVFLDDDVKIIDNYSKLTDIENIGNVFKTDSYYMEGGYYYRPTLTLSLMLNAEINGKDSFGYHLFNVILHLIF